MVLIFILTENLEVRLTLNYLEFEDLLLLIQQEK